MNAQSGAEASGGATEQSASSTSSQGGESSAQADASSSDASESAASSAASAAASSAGAETQAQSGDEAMQVAEQSIEAANAALDEASVAVAEAAGAGGEDSATEAAASGEENLQAAAEATEGARQALQGLVDMIAASQMAASGMGGASGADSDQMDDASGGLPGDIGSPEYQEALKQAVGEALSEAAREIEKASGALAEAARQSQGDDSASSEPRLAAAGSEKAGHRAESQDGSDDVSGEELAARLAEMQGLARVMNAINDGMRATEQGGLSSANRQASTRLILEGDVTTIPGSILLPGGISLPLGLGLPGALGRPTGDGGNSPGTVMVAGGVFESGSNRRASDDGQGALGSGSVAVVIIPGAQSSSDLVAVLDTTLLGSLRDFDGIILASQGSRMGESTFAF